MAMTGEDKEMRIPGSLTYDQLENSDHNPVQHHNPVQPEGSRSVIPGLNSTGSKSKAPMVITPPAGRNSTTTIAASSGVGGGTARYRECLKNHAANIGGNVTDGCGEFMPSGEDGTLEALKCAACNCHRNFHRKEPIIENAIVIHNPFQHHHHHPPPPPPQMASPAMNHHHHHWPGMIQPVKMAFGGGGSASGGTESSSEELNFNTYQSTSVQPPLQYVLAKKRFRTKFTPDQKEKMMAFAEKLGWRIPREDDSEVQRFCAEVGVKRQVFKVWMHNNKNSGKKNPEDS